MSTAPSAVVATRRLRVCIVVYADFVVDSRIQRQALALADAGHEVDIIHAGAPARLTVGTGTIRLHRVESPKSRGAAASYFRFYGRFFLGALRKLSGLELRRGFDVVQVANMPNFLTATAVIPKLRGVPLVLDVHDTFPELFATKFGLPVEHPLVGAMRLEERWSARLADVVLTVTEEARQRLRSRGVGNGSVDVLLNSPDERVFGARQSPVEVPRDGPLRVVYHGGLAPRFGVETLIRAVGLLGGGAPSVQLDVYGSFDENGEVAALGRKVAPDRIRVAPAPVPFQEIPARLAGSHVGVVPTLHDEFTELLLPVKLMEYVHMGIPVVSSRLPVIENYFSDAEVLFFEAGSPESLADAIADVGRQPEEARARAARASERLEALEWPRQRARYLSLIDSLGRRRTGTAA